MVRVHPTVPFEISRKSYLFRAARFTWHHGRVSVGSAVRKNPSGRTQSVASTRTLITLKSSVARARKRSPTFARSPSGHSTTSPRTSLGIDSCGVGRGFLQRGPTGTYPLCLKGGLADQKLNRTQNAYESDYAIWAPLQEWATTHGVAVLGLHHTREGAADDPLEALSGSNGLSACADTTIVLDQDQNGRTLYVRGPTTRKKKPL